ncbi:hypothetical protein FT663_04449 [Candidozyma haemuli var. vulneris]|uniref:BUB1 N-terminal domain-containing protein n=1 Tax=Candidozyma haemuli TaxID=45357 RepID=A0A2V1AU25_9ASCO|nr:hypothetical protein CXQ85_004301 [[Candida] haemuloni]KAF3987455.1 hypothetical protein FT663_04449 [[Candida] haemuloni var. vulneris]KAF3991761.1 hypothetical protein FT662_01515 [[Candida] haemuloni var. vulneris]PVH20793.1 hypothetical protein CXQ85_004301 [[Candida] haemuloni]
MDFSVLEQQKENIQPKVTGRPASRLALALKEHAPKSAVTSKKNEFESAIAQYDELDDPLQAYLDYINWTNEAFPQGGNTESGLLGLLERCTSCFRDTEFYKNDPRYLRVWLEYSQYSDSPRDIFVYLAKKGIGCELALYYEEFAKYLETKGAYGDASEVYNIGIEREARPLTRLQRNYGYFQRRTENFDVRPSTIRNVLSLKRGSPLTSSGSGSDKKRPKFDVHRDSDPVGIKDSVFGASEAPDSLPVLRLKENVISAKPWAGEVLKQKSSRPSSAKFEVFRDSEPQKEWHVSSGPEKHTIIQHPGKRTEKLMLNMALLYPAPNEEYCPTEIFCQVKNFSAEREKQAKPIEPLERSREDTGMTIPLNLDESTSQLRPRSPTMTQFSRMTAKEVLGMFNNASRYSDGDTTKFEEHTSNLDGFVTETFHQEKQPATPSTDCGSSRSSPFLDRPW